MISSPEEFIALMNSDDAADRRRAAWEEAPDEVWRTLVETRGDVSFWVAHNRTVPPQVLRLLVTDPDWRVRSRVASKRKCPPEILRLLSDDENEAVLATVAGHPNTPTDALVRLTGHSWSQVRERARRQLAQRESS
jgi:hypothetical protein